MTPVRFLHYLTRLFPLADINRNAHRTDKTFGKLRQKGPERLVFEVKINREIRVTENQEKSIVWIGRYPKFATYQENVRLLVPIVATCCRTFSRPRSCVASRELEVGSGLVVSCTTATESRKVLRLQAASFAPEFSLRGASVGLRVRPDTEGHRQSERVHRRYPLVSSRVGRVKALQPVLLLSH